MVHWSGRGWSSAPKRRVKSIFLTPQVVLREPGERDQLRSREPRLITRWSATTDKESSLRSLDHTAPLVGLLVGPMIHVSHASAVACPQFRVDGIEEAGRESTTWLTPSPMARHPTSIPPCGPLGSGVDHSWIYVHGTKDEDGRIQHERGVTPAAGLYMLGLPWQHARASALLGWVARDPEFLAERMSTIDSSTTGGGAR
jgi:hypothetical protein